MGEILVRYNDVTISQQELSVLEHVTLELQAGEFVYLTGKVGSGKTSLLKTIYGEIPLSSGEAEVLDYDLRHLKRKQVSALRRQLGIVFQDFQLLTDRTVRENLLFVLQATGWKRKVERDERIQEVLNLVGMAHKGYKYPYELSGGEQQRIVIARAILNSPRIILADEPTGNLDPETGYGITTLLYELAKQGTLVVMATHNMQLMQMFPGRVYRCTPQHAIVEIENEQEI